MVTNNFLVLLYAIRIILKREVGTCVYVYTESIQLFTFIVITLMGVQQLGWAGQ